MAAARCTAHPGKKARARTKRREVLKAAESLRKSSSASSISTAGAAAPLLSVTADCEAPAASKTLDSFLKSLPALSTTEKDILNEIQKKLAAAVEKTETAPSTLGKGLEVSWLIVKGVLDLVFATGYASLAYTTMSKATNSTAWGWVFAAASAACNAAQGWYALDLPDFAQKLFKKIPYSETHPYHIATGLVALSAALGYWSLFPTLPLFETLEADLSHFPATAWMDDSSEVKTGFIAMMAVIRDALFVKSLFNMPMTVYAYLKDSWDSWHKHDNRAYATFNLLSLIAGSYIAYEYSQGQIPKVEMAAPSLGVDPQAAGFAALVPLIALNTLFIAKGIKALEKLNTFQACLSLIVASLTGGPGVALLQNAGLYEQALSYSAAVFSNYASLIGLDFVANKIKTTEMLRTLADLKEELQAQQEDAPTETSGHTETIAAITKLESTIHGKIVEQESAEKQSATTWYGAACTCLSALNPANLCLRRASASA